MCFAYRFDDDSILYEHAACFFSAMPEFPMRKAKWVLIREWLVYALARVTCQIPTFTFIANWHNHVLPGTCLVLFFQAAASYILASAIVSWVVWLDSYSLLLSLLPSPTHLVPGIAILVTVIHVLFLIPPPPSIAPQLHRLLTFSPLFSLLVGLNLYSAPGIATYILVTVIHALCLIHLLYRPHSCIHFPHYLGLNLYYVVVGL